MLIAYDVLLLHALPRLYFTITLVSISLLQLYHTFPYTCSAVLLFPIDHVPFGTRRARIAGARAQDVRGCIVLGAQRQC
jgi:hypothetical protein